MGVLVIGQNGRTLMPTTTRKAGSYWKKTKLLLYADIRSRFICGIKPDVRHRKEVLVLIQAHSISELESPVEIKWSSKMNTNYVPLWRNVPWWRRGQRCGVDADTERCGTGNRSGDIIQNGCISKRRTGRGSTGERWKQPHSHQDQKDGRHRHCSQNVTIIFALSTGIWNTCRIPSRKIWWLK